MAVNLFQAAPWPTPTVVESLPVTVAKQQHHQVGLADLQHIFDDGFETVAQVAGEQGSFPAGPAFACYEGDPTQVFDLELGFPVAPALKDASSGASHVIPGTFLTGKVAVTSTFGSYDGLGQAWAEFTAWLIGAGHLPGPKYAELYVSMPGPDLDPESLRTDLVIQLL